jgi:hypothetical protein
MDPMEETLAKAVLVFWAVSIVYFASTLFSLTAT